MDFEFFHVEIIPGFTFTFVDIYYTNSYPFEFSSWIKHLPIDILKSLATTLRNQDNNVAFIQVDEDVALTISNEFMCTYHNTNIIVQTIGRYDSLMYG